MYLDGYPGQKYSYAYTYIQIVIKNKKEVQKVFMDIPNATEKNFVEI